MVAAAGWRQMGERAFNVALPVMILTGWGPVAIFMRAEVYPRPIVGLAAVTSAVFVAAVIQGFRYKVRRRD